MTASADNFIVTEFFARHDDVEWSKIIEQARTIDIVVYYYGRWAKEHAKALGRFLNVAVRCD